MFIRNILKPTRAWLHKSEDCSQLILCVCVCVCVCVCITRWLTIHYVVMNFKNGGQNHMCDLTSKGSWSQQKEQKKSKAFWPRWSACVGSKMRRVIKEQSKLSPPATGFSIVTTQMHQCEVNFTMHALIIKMGNEDALFYVVRKHINGILTVQLGHLQNNTKLCSVQTQKPICELKTQS